MSLGGFAYQMGYAVARLASMHAMRPILGLDGFPVLLRYDWAEDLDEVDGGGRTVLTQCKRVSDIGQPAQLADILLGFAPSEPCTGDPAGRVLPAERAALDLLLREQVIEPARQRETVESLRALIHGNVVAFDPAGPATLPVLDREPSVISPDDVRYDLFRFREGDGREPPFQVVSRQSLARASSKKKDVYVARPPEWEDVVHGQDHEVKFLEREQTAALVDEVRRLLVGRLGEGRRLPALFVLGAPGAGKSTLVRRVAALLVQGGLPVVAAPKLNLGRIEKDELDPFIERLDGLATGTLPVLLVLDDPFFDGSGWIPLLDRIARSSSKIAVLGATPDYLYEKYGHELKGKQVDCRTFELRATTSGEKAALASLHGRDPSSFGEGRDDFLVLTMEAAAGHSFEQIINRIWMTLNNGQSIPPHARPEELPWPVRAFLLACYFNRMDLGCPIVVMRAALERSGKDRPEGDYEIGILTNAQGWRIFRVIEDMGYLEHLGGRIAAAHARIALEAWRQRPVPAFNVADWVVPASLDPSAECAVMNVGELSAKLSLTGDRADARLVDRLVQAWNEAARAGLVEARNVGLLHSALSMRGRPTDAARLRPALAACAARMDPQSWLAVLALSHGAPAGKNQRPWEGLDLAGIIGVADFHVAPKRAAQLLRALADRPELREAFVARVLATADQPEAHKLLQILVVLYPERAEVLGAIDAWLDANSDKLEECHSLLTGLLPRAGSAEHLLRHAEAYVAAGHRDREGIAALLITAGGAAPRYIELAVDLLFGETGKARDTVFDRLARALVETPGAAVDYLIHQKDAARRRVVLECLAALCGRSRRSLASLLCGAVARLDDDDLRALLEALFGSWIAPPTRHFLLAKADLDPRVRAYLTARQPAEGRPDKRNAP